MTKQIPSNKSCFLCAVAGVAALLCVAGLQAADPLPPDPIAPLFADRIIPRVIHDADTISQCAVDMGWGLTLDLPHGIRAANFDAWEVDHTRKTVNVTDVEIVRGKEALADLIGLLNAGGELFAEPSNRADPYSRRDAILWVRQKDGSWIYLAKWMEERGHLRVPRNGTLNPQP